MGPVMIAVATSSPSVNASPSFPAAGRAASTRRGCELEHDTRRGISRKWGQDL